MLCQSVQDSWLHSSISFTHNYHKHKLTNYIFPNYENETWGLIQDTIQLLITKYTHMVYTYEMKI